jgi:putative tricarboxylic transport membrane protein
MRTAEVICAAAILVVGAVVCYDSTNLGIVGWGDSGPEAGLYPFLLGAATIALSAVVLGQTLRRSRRRQPTQPFIPPGAWKQVASVGVPAGLMLFLTDFIGLYLAAGLYLAVYMRWIGKHRWVTVTVVSILIPLAGYIVFRRWFLIPLPEGSVWAQVGF